MAKPRQMPQSPNSESAILGIVFLDQNKLNAIMDRISDDDFYSQKNKAIYQALKELFLNNLSIDYATTIGKMKDMGLSAHIDVDYIVELSEEVPTTTHLDTYIEIVKEASLKRQIIQAASEILEDGYLGEQGGDDYLDAAEQKIFELAQKRKAADFRQIKEIVEEVKRKTHLQQDSKKVITGLSTGFPKLDDMTLGFHEEELIILASRPAMGKSAYAMNLAINIAKRNFSHFDHKKRVTVAIFSLEMSNEQLAARMISAEADINNKKIRNGDLSTQEWISVNAASETLSNLNIVFDDSAAVTVQDIRAKCRQLSQSKGLDFVVIDYLQLVKGNDRKNSNRQEEVGAISRALKQMARELKIPILALAQLSRALEQRSDKDSNKKNIPMLADLRESGSIEQDADIVMFLYREDYYKKTSDEPPVTSIADLIIAKNRHGISGVTLKYNFLLPVSRFNEIGVSIGDSD